MRNYIKLSGLPFAILLSWASLSNANPVVLLADAEQCLANAYLSSSLAPLPAIEEARDSCSGLIERYVSSFPDDQQPMVRSAVLEKLQKRGEALDKERRRAEYLGGGA